MQWVKSTFQACCKTLHTHLGGARRTWAKNCFDGISPPHPPPFCPVFEARRPSYRRADQPTDRRQKKSPCCTHTFRRQNPPPPSPTPAFTPLFGLTEVLKKIQQSLSLGFSLTCISGAFNWLICAFSEMQRIQKIPGLYGGRWAAFWNIPKHWRSCLTLYLPFKTNKLSSAQPLRTNLQWHIYEGYIFESYRWTVSPCSDSVLITGIPARKAISHLVGTR